MKNYNNMFDMDGTFHPYVGEGHLTNGIWYIVTELGYKKYKDKDCVFIKY